MKKLCILVIAALAMVSCGKTTYTAQPVELADQSDSMNYALGLVNGAQIKKYQLRNDSTIETIYEFLARRWWRWATRSCVKCRNSGCDCNRDAYR